MHILGMSLRGLMRQRSAGPQPPTQAAAVAPATTAAPATPPASGMAGVLSGLAARAKTGAPSTATPSPTQGVIQGVPNAGQPRDLNTPGGVGSVFGFSSGGAPTSPGSPSGSMGGILSRLGGGGPTTANPFGINPSALEALAKGGAGGGMLSAIGAHVPLGTANPSPQGNSMFGGALARLGLATPSLGNEGNPGNSNVNAPMNAPSDASGLVSRMKQAMSDAGDSSSSEY